MVEKKVRYVRISPQDNTALALVNLSKGNTIIIEELSFILFEDVPYMHKFSVRKIALGEHIVKKGEIIGIATKPIRQGEHVHVHNMKGLV